MTKTDNRIYNRKSRRDLSIEMDLYIFFMKKHISAPNYFYNNISAVGIVVNVIYNSNTCTCEIDNGSQYCFSVKYGKIIIPDSVTISTPLL